MDARSLRWWRVGAAVAALAGVLGCARTEPEFVERATTIAGRADPEVVTAPLVPTLVLRDGQPYVVYVDHSDGRLYRAYPSGASWDVAPIAVDVGSTQWGTALAAALRSDGTLAIALRDEATRNLVYLEGDDAGWTATTPLPPGEDRGDGLDLAVDLGDNPWIAFHNATTGALEVVHRSGGNWILEVVDTEGNTGWWPAIAADWGGRMYVAYHDATSGALWFASTNGGGNWERELVDDRPDHVVGTWTDIALRPAGNQDLFLTFPRILYLDETDYTPWYAEQDTMGTWTRSPVDPELFGGSDGCLAVAPDGTVLAAYFDAANLDLRVARLRDGIWRAWTELAVGAVGMWTRCAADGEGRLHLVTYRHDTGTLEYRAVVPRF